MQTALRNSELQGGPFPAIFSPPNLVKIPPAVLGRSLCHTRELRALLFTVVSCGFVPLPARRRKPPVKKVCCGDFRVAWVFLVLTPPAKEARPWRGSRRPAVSGGGAPPAGSRLTGRRRRAGPGRAGQPSWASGGGRLVSFPAGFYSAIVFGISTPLPTRPVNYVGLLREGGTLSPFVCTRPSLMVCLSATARGRVRGQQREEGRYSSGGSGADVHFGKSR